jgi:hypothetical protein
MKWIPVLLALAALVPGPSFGQAINTNPPASALSAGAARLFIGETNTIIGRVAQVSVREKVVYLNLGKPYPDMLCSGVIFAGRTNQFGDLTQLQGKIVLITGKIVQYNDQPQIVIDSKEQLEVVEEPSAVPSEIVGSTGKDSVKSESPPTAATQTNLENADAVRQEIANMQVTNRAKDLFIEQLQKDREHYVEQLMEFNRKFGELETKLLQLQAPTSSVASNSLAR